MKRGLAVLLMVAAVLAFSGCGDSEDTASETRIDTNQVPQVLIFDPEVTEPPRATVEDTLSPAVVIHPDLRGKPKSDEAQAVLPGTEEDAELELRVLSKFADGNNLRLTMAVINNGKGGKNINLFLFNYDSTGTLLTTDMWGRYLAPDETWIFQRNFSAVSRDSRWVFRAVRRK